MKLTLRQQITQFAHVLQTGLFPVLNEELGELTPPAKRLVATLEMIPLGVCRNERFSPILTARYWGCLMGRSQYTVVEILSPTDS